METVADWPPFAEPFVEDEPDPFGEDEHAASTIPTDKAANPATPILRHVSLSRPVGHRRACFDITECSEPPASWMTKVSRTHPIDAPPARGPRSRQGPADRAAPVLARRHPRWGYQRTHAVLRREGHHHLNRKKVQRLWREEGLRVPPRQHKRPRIGVSTTPADRLFAAHPNHVWALDYRFDVTTAGRKLKILHITDEFTRESLSDLVACSIDADRTVEFLDQLVT